MSKTPKGKSFSYRLRRDFEPLMDELCGALEREKAYFLDKALEALMPEWERRYADELREFRDKKNALNDAANSTPEVLADRVAHAVAGPVKKYPKLSHKKAGH